MVEPILVSSAELERRIHQVSEGDAKGTVSDILGAPPFEEEEKHGTLCSFWRFAISDRSRSAFSYEIYLGEFVENRLAFGSIIPRSASQHPNTMTD